MMTSLSESPIFIGGYPRSGTTLITSLLDSHPELLVYPRETQFFKLVLPLFKRSPDLALDFLIWDTSQSSWYAEHLYEAGQAIDQFHEHLRELFHLLGGSAKALLQAIVLAHARVTGQEHKRFWVEKTPLNEWHAQTIFRWFPSAKMIYIARDPRATYASVGGFKMILRQRQMGALRFCIEWDASIRANRRNAGRFPVLTVRYEDLVGDPRPTLVTICEFLGIPFQDTLLQPTFDGADFTGFSAYSSFATQYTTIDRSSLTKWKEVLGQHDIRVIDYLLAPELAALGYKTAAPPRSIGMMFRYGAPYRLGQSVLRAPEPVQRLVRSIVGSPPNRVDQYKQWRQTQAGRRGTAHE